MRAAMQRVARPRPRSWAAAGLLALALGTAGPGGVARPGVALPAGPAPAATLAPGMTPEPPRHVAFSRNCPPNGRHRTPAIAPTDRDVDGDGRPDYFMGSWTFVDPHGYGLVITLWCLKRRPAVRKVGHHRRRFLHYNDQFALQIATRASANAPLVTQVAPTHPICPFVEGVNLGLGFRPHACLGIAQPPFDRIPPRITWISVNQHVGGDNRPTLGALEHLYWPQTSGGVARGRIYKMRHGVYRFEGSFAIGGTREPAASLTADERRLLIADMAVNIQRARVEDRGCDIPDFGTAPASGAKAPAGAQPPVRALSRTR